MKVKEVVVEDMLASLESCKRQLSRLKSEEVDFQSLEAVSRQFSQLAMECSGLAGAARYEYDMKRGGK